MSGTPRAAPGTTSGAQYRDTSEALHRDTTVHQRNYDNLVMFGACGYNSLIRDDFYRLFDFAPDGGERRGNVLDAGCGSGVDLINLGRLAPGMALYGVDVSSVLLGQALQRPSPRPLSVHQAALEAIPFADASFDAIASHEVVEHVEDPAVVLKEFFRVLKPGGVAVIATPNGASLWSEHLRQRLARLMGRRGAPVGADHTRPPGFWRRAFARTGFVVERQIFDAAAIEFQTYVAPAAWMPWLGRCLEPLRDVPGLRLLVCDRVKFRLRKPGTPAPADAAPVACCTVCRAPVTFTDEGAHCGNGHRFIRTASGPVDFTEAVGAAPAAAAVAPAATKAQPGWAFQVERWLRRAAILVYAAWLLPLLPLGFLAGLRHQPFDRVAKDAWNL